MWPNFRDLQFPARALCCQRIDSHTGRESIGNIAVQLDGNFADPPLRFDHAGEGDELVPCSGLAYSKISRVKRL